MRVWLDLAFEGPHPNRREVGVSEPGILPLFVRFYWALSHDHGLATTILDKERKRRGYRHRSDIRAKQSTLLASTADLTKLKKAHTKQKRILQTRNNVIDEKTTARPPQREDTGDKSDHVSNGALRNQSPLKEMNAGSIPAGLKFKKTLNAKKDVPGCREREAETFSQSCPPSRDSSQKKLKLQKNFSSDLQVKREHLSQDCSPSVGPRSELVARDGSSKVDIDASAFPPRLKSSITPAVHNPFNREKRAATSRDVQPAKGKQGPRQTNGVVAGKKAIDTNKKLCNVLNGLTSDQPLDSIKRHGNHDGMRSDRVSKPETTHQTEGYLPQGCPPAVDPRTDDSPEKQGTSVPHIDRSVLQSSSDQCNTSAISNSRKRRSNSLDAILPKEVGRAEEAITTSHRETKRRKVVQKETLAEPVEDGTTTVPAHKQSRGKRGMCTEEQGLVKAESPDRSIIQSETHPTTDLPPINGSLSHQPEQDETIINRKRESASSSEDRQHKRQAVGVDQEDSVPITVHPDPVKRKSGRQAQLNDEVAVPLSGQKVEMQELSISNPFIPAQGHDAFDSQEIVGELSRHDHIPRPTSDGNMEEELLNASEKLLQAEEHNLVEEGFALDYVAPAAMEGHPADIFPTQKPPLDVRPPIWAQVRDRTLQ